VGQFESTLLFGHCQPGRFPSDITTGYFNSIDARRVGVGRLGMGKHGGGSGGGNAHDRAMAKAKMEPVNPSQTPSATVPPVAPNREPPERSRAEKLIRVVENPLFLLVCGVLGGILGLIYTPLLFLSVACIMAAFHREGVFSDLVWKKQIAWYLVVFIISTGFVYWAVGEIKQAAHSQIDEIAVRVKSLVWPNPPAVVPLVEVEKLPDLHLELIKEMAAPVGEKGRDTMMCLPFNVINRGGPGTITNLKMTLSIDGHVLNAEYPVPPDPRSTTTFSENSGAGLSLKGKDYWDYKLAGQTITPRVSVGAWVTGVFRGIREKDVLDKRALIVLNATDSMGGQSSVEYRFTGKNERPFSLHDLQGKTPRPAKQP